MIQTGYTSVLGLETTDVTTAGTLWKTQSSAINTAIIPLARCLLPEICGGQTDDVAGYEGVPRVRLPQHSEASKAPGVGM